MAARLLQRNAAAPVAAIVLGSAVLYPRTALAEAPDHFSKKPIYDDYTSLPAKPLALPPAAETEAPSPAATSDATATPSALTSTTTTTTATRHRLPTPTDRLAGQIRTARLFLYRQVRAAEDGVNRAADRVFDLEKSLTQTVASLAPSRESGEQLMPGAVYVLVAAMAGSMVTRRSNILLRATVPLAVGVGAGWTLLPVTMRNVADLVWTYEQRVPSVAQAHLRTREAIEHSLQMARLHADLTKTYAVETVHNARETVMDWAKKGK